MWRLGFDFLILIRQTRGGDDDVEFVGDFGVDDVAAVDAETS